MDSHVSTQCRRAKRSKAKSLDLSGLGLPRWNPAIFDLVELEALQLNDNSLTNVPPEICSLERLTTLDLSNNKIEKLPSFDFDKMQDLASINLEGNPVAQTMSTRTLKQLVHPEQVPGKSTAQVLRRILADASSATSGSAAAATLPSKPSEVTVDTAKPARKTTDAGRPAALPRPEEKKNDGTSLAEYMKSLDESEEEYSDDFQDSEDDAAKALQGKPGRAKHDGKSGKSIPEATGAAPRTTHWDGSDSDKEAKPPSRASDTRNTAGRLQPATNGRRPAGDIGKGSTESKTALDDEATIARLQKQVKELQSELAASRKPVDNEHKVNFASTLPSRLHAFDESEGADKLKQQLQEEQRRSKRLERDNQKLQDRMRESAMSSGSTAAPHVDLSEIQEGDILSKSGGFSIIYRGTWHGTAVAIKKLFDPSNSRENLAEMDNEVDKLGKLRHPNIVSLLAVHRKPPVYSIIMEVVTGGSLFQLLHSKQSFCFARPGVNVQLKDLISIDESMAQALAFMHARNVVHRDVKSHNVLLSPHLEAKLCDFGLARMKSELMTGAMQYAGTPQYMAPELFLQQKYAEKVDAWAFGILLWESVADDIPFVNLDVPEIRQLVTSGKVLPIPASAPRPLQAIIKSCWTVDQNSRATIADILIQIRNFCN